MFHEVFLEVSKAFRREIAIAMRASVGRALIDMLGSEK